MTGIIRILIVDEQGLMLEGLRTILDLEDDFQVVGTAKTGREALRVCETTEPDVIVMDIGVPNEENIAALAYMKENYLQMKALGLSTHNTDECVLGALEAGADGYLLKDSPSEELIKAIRTVVSGGAALAPTVAARVVGHLKRLLASEVKHARWRVPLNHQLTDRETEVLRLVARGLSNREIAEALYVTEGTVKNHVSSICQKLGARDRTQVAVYAWQSYLAQEAPAAGEATKASCWSASATGLS